MTASAAEKARAICAHEKGTRKHSMKPYPEYKDSGFEWVGSIPAHWRVGKLGACFEERNEKVSDEEFAPLSVTKNGIVPQMEHVAKTDAGDNRKKVCINDFVINSRSDRKGASGISAYEGSVSLISIVLKPREHHPVFIHHLLRSYNFQEEFYRFGKGIVADLWSTRYAEMKSISIPLLPMNEQVAIAKYLDRETARIDNLIAEKQNFINLLKEKRQALISHVVTKGLDPKAKMKDSGIEWIGEVPEHWDFSPIRYLSRFVGTGGTPKNAESFCEEGGIPWYSPGDLSGELVLDSSHKSITSSSVEENDAKLYPQKSIVVVGIGATLGKVALSQVEFSCNQQMNVIVPNSKVTPEFLVLALSAQQEQMRALSSASTLPIMNQEKTKRVVIAVPPMNEQRDVVAYVGARDEKVAVTIAEVTRSIELLREHRTALISAAVTGKIDVREQQ